MARFGRTFPVPRRLPNVNLLGIQFDAASSSGYEASLASYSWNHTCTGANRGLIVSISIFAAGTVTALTYNSVAMTFVRADTNGVYRNEIWKLANPASGTNSIAVTLSASVTSIGSASSYTGVDQTNIVEANNGANGSNSTPTASVTTVSPYAWVVDGLATADTTQNPVSGQRARANNVGALGTGAISDKGPVGVPAATSMTWEATGALDSWALGVVALKPLGVPDTVTTRTITGISRITATTTKTQTGVSSILDANKVYSYENRATLPTNDANLANLFVYADYVKVATDNTVYFDLTGSNTYNVNLYKYKNANNTDAITLTWNGKSDKATTTTTSYLQIYNYNTASWETLDTDSTTAANTEYTLTGGVSSSVANYYTTGNWTAVRVYQ